MTIDDEPVAAATKSPPRTEHSLLRRFWLLVSFMLCIMGLAAFATCFAKLHWLADLFANLRVQQMIALVSLTIITLCYRRWRWMLFSLVLIFVHLPWFLTAWTGRDAHQSGTAGLTVMVANVLTSNRQHGLVVEQLRKADPDVFAILELSGPLDENLEKQFSKTYPYRVTIPQDDGNFGIGLFSRYELSNVEQFSLNIESIQTLAATIRKDGESYRVFATHPLPPMGADGFSNRNDHLRQLMERVSEYQQANPGEPVIVMGDLNLTPWSPIFYELLATANLTRAEERSGIVDGLVGGLTPTWHAYANASFPFGLALDHVLISDDLNCVSHRVGDAMGSDHRAVAVGLSRR